MRCNVCILIAARRGVYSFVQAEMLALLMDAVNRANVQYDVERPFRERVATLSVRDGFEGLQQKLSDLHVTVGAGAGERARNFLL